MIDWAKLDIEKCVYCATKEEFAELMEECNKHGIKTYGGESPTEIEPYIIDGKFFKGQYLSLSMKGIELKVGILFKSRNGKLCENNFEYCKLKLLEFDETERNLLQAYVGTGHPWIAREKGTSILRAFKNEPEKLESKYAMKDNPNYEIASQLLQQITWENSPINAADYIESEGKNDG